MRLLAVLVSLTSLAAGAAAAADARAEGPRSETLTRRAFDMRPSPDAVRRASRTAARPLQAPVAGATGHRSGGRQLWEDRNDVSPFEQFFSAATAGGRVYAAGYVWSETGRDTVVRALDARDGGFEWEERADTGDDEFASGVATDGRHVYVSGAVFQGATDYDWALRAYDPETGARLWESTFDLVGRTDIPRGTALAAGLGLVFLGGYGTNAQDQGDFNTDWILRAYDADTGALVWEDRIEGFSGVYTLTYEGGRLFAGGWTRTATNTIALTRAYDARSGRRLWERGRPGNPSFPEGTWTKVVKAQGGRVFAGHILIDDASKAAPQVQAFDARTGRVLWTRGFESAGDDWLDDLDVAGPRVTAVGYGGSECGQGVDSNCDAMIRTYSAAHGTLLWRRQLDLTGMDDHANLVAATAGTVFVHSGAGPLVTLLGCCEVGQWTLSALDAQDGSFRWQTLGGEGEAGVYNMVLDHGRLFVPGRAVNHETGEWDPLVRAYDASGQGEVDMPLRRQLSASGASGQESFRVRLDAPVAAAAHRMVAAVQQPGVVPDDPTNDVWTALATGIGVVRVPIVVPPGTRALRAALFDEATDGAHDLDLYLFRQGFGLVAVSAHWDSTESITSFDPAPGNYTLVVHAYETEGPQAHFTLSRWVLDGGAAGNLSVTGPTAGGNVRVSWGGLAPGRHLGAVSFTGASGEVGQTLVSVRVPE